MALSVSQISFPLKIPNINELDSVFSQEVIVQNIPWRIKICKTSVDAKQWLGVGLFCQQKGVQTDWYCSAQFSVKLMSFDKNVVAIERQQNPDVFGMNGLGFGTSKWVEWADLLNSAKKFVENDIIQLKIKIKVDDESNENRTKVSLEAQDKCCKDSALAIYLLTVTNVDKLMAAPSPEFQIKDLPFDLIVYKSPSSQLHICLRSKKSHDEIHNIRVTCKLVSFKAGESSPIEKIKSKKMCGGDIFDSDEIISWTALFDAQSGFVDGNTIKIQVKLEVFKPEETIPALNERCVCNNGANILRVECVICFESLKDQNVSSTECGHVFCTACIATAIKDRKACPSCNVPIAEEKLRPVYLPMYAN